MVTKIKKWLKKGSEPKPEFCEAVAKVAAKVRRNKMKKATTVTVGACVLLTAGGCAHVQGWLANGPSITLSAGVGPATVSLALNPGKTIVDVAETVTETVGSVIPTSGEVEAVPAPVAPATETR